MNLKNLGWKHLIVLSSVFLLYDCASYVRDSFDYTRLKTGWIGPNTFQFWYQASWDQTRYHIDGLQKEKKQTKKIRLVSLIQGSEISISPEKIRLKANQILAVMYCQKARINLLGFLSGKPISYRIVQQEYYLNKTVNFLIRIRSDKLLDRIKNIRCRS